MSQTLAPLPPVKRGNKPMDLAGHTFGWLNVKRLHSTTKRGGKVWWCQCKCGREGPYFQGNLRGGYSTKCRACGTNRTHGMTGSREYQAFSTMWAKHSDEICDEWIDFEPFFEAMGKKPAGSVLRRRDESQPYGPGNCYWGKRPGTRIPAKYTAAGRSLSINEWSARIGVSRQRVYQILKDRGESGLKVWLEGKIA